MLKINKLHGHTSPACWILALFDIANLSSDWLKATYFDIEINVPYHLERHVYLIDKQERNAGLSIEQLEERRQEALAQYLKQNQNG